MRRAGQLVAAVLATLALTASATAQIQTGSILMRASDELGALMPGVTVTISSPVLVAGQMSGVTDAGGAYRFPALLPGTYAVRLDLEGFQTVVREGVVVSVGQTTPIALILKVASVQEIVTVTGESPVVDTTSANVNVTLDRQLLQGTPGGRDIWSLVEYKVPGLISSRPDVGGTSGGLQGGMTARGTPNAQNSQFLNGINVGDPAAIGFSGFYYDYDAFEEVQVSTGAHDISVPTSGVFLNMVTKSGTDRYRGQAAIFWEGDATQGRNVDAELQNLGFRPDTNKVDFVSDLTAQIGGPLVKDKVRFFTSFRDWRVHVNVPAAFSEQVLDETNMTSGLANVSWQVNNANRVTGFYARQYYRKPNRFLGSSALYTGESNSNEDDVFDIVQGLWNSVLTHKLFVDARVSFNRVFFPLYYNGADQALTDLSTGILLRNELSEQIFIRRRLQASATFNYYLDRALGGRHELRFGVDHAHTPTSTEVHRWDDLTLAYRSATSAPVSVTFYNTPAQSKAAVDVTALFIQDAYTVNNLSVTAGLRWERIEGYLPEQSSPPSHWFPDLVRRFDEVRDIVNWKTAGPRVSAVYDLRGDGRTALKANWGRYYYTIGTGTPNTANPNFSVSAQYGWTDANGDLRFQPGEQTGVPVYAGGLTTSFDPGARRPYTDELTAGVDHELAPSLKLSAVFTYRAERQPQASANIAAPLDTWVMVTRPDPGPDGLAGTPDDGIYSYYDRTLSGSITVIDNDPTSRQTYKGVEITLTKRFSRKWMMLAGYTYSQATLTDLSVGTSPNAFLNTEGRIFNDRPQQLKLSGSYVLPRDVYVGANLRVQSGPPINRQISAPLSFGGSATINVEPQAAHRLDTLTTIDLRAAKTFRLASNREIEVDFDIFNLTNANTAWERRPLTGRLNVRQGGDANGAVLNIQQFLSPSQILAPRIARIGAVVRF